jgi:hypothetical protein
VPDQNGSFSCNQRADTLCQIRSLPRTWGLENANGANLFLWLPTALVGVHLTSTVPVTMHWESKQGGQGTIQMLANPNDPSIRTSGCVGARIYELRQGGTGLTVTTYSDQACSQEASICYLWPISSMAHPFQAKYIETWDYSYDNGIGAQACAPADPTNPFTYTIVHDGQS